MQPEKHIITLVGVPLRLCYTILCGLVKQGAIDRAQMGAFLMSCYSDLSEAERFGVYGQILKKVADDVSGSGHLDPAKLTLH